MEIKINLIDVEEARKSLSNLKNKVNGNPVSIMETLIQKSSGGVCDEVNEFYRSLKRIEVALSELIETTEIVVLNTKSVVVKTDTGIAQTFEDTYSGNSIGKYPSLGSSFLLNK